MTPKERFEKLKQIQYTGDTPHKLEQFKKIIKEYDKDAKPFESHGYLFYNSGSSLFNGNRKIQAKETKYHEKDFDSIELRHWRRTFIRGEAHEKKIVKETLATEYKIHLMPKVDYLLPVVERLLKLRKRDPSLANLINTFKIKINTYIKPKAQIMPRIVIYPALGKENAKLLLTKLTKEFSCFNCDEIGIDIPPRYNKKVNSLLYYSQGGGDLKNEILAKLPETKRDEFLSKKGVHYAWGKHLSVVPVKEPLKIFQNLLNDIMPKSIKEVKLKEKDKKPYIKVKILLESILERGAFTDVLEKFDINFDESVNDVDWAIKIPLDEISKIVNAKEAMESFTKEFHSSFIDRSIMHLLGIIKENLMAKMPGSIQDLELNPGTSNTPYQHIRIIFKKHPDIKPEKLKKIFDRLKIKCDIGEKEGISMIRITTADILKSINVIEFGDDFKKLLRKEIHKKTKRFKA